MVLQKSALRETWKKNYPRDLSVRQSASERTCTFIRGTDFFGSAKKIGLFSSLAWEPDIAPLWKLHPQKCVFPRIVDGKIQFFKVSSLQQLKPGYAGILEPPIDQPVSPWSKEDLILVPGFAFDVFGGRVGTGKGYYDKFFAENEKPARWGVCYAQQFYQEELAQEKTDVRMGAVVTEQGFFLAKTP